MILLILLLASSAVFAQAPDGLSKECRTEVEKLCPPHPGLRKRVECLKEARKNFSTQCKEELLRYVQLNRQAFTRTGGSMSGLGGMNILGPAFPTLSYDGRYMEPKDGPAFTENRTNIQWPIYKNEKGRLSYALSASKLHINDEITLSSGKKLPQDLNRIETGLNYSHQLPEKRMFGVRGSVGYTGDKVFEAGNNFAYSLMGFYGFPGPDEKSNWAVTAFMTNNSFFAANIPIPGFMYFYRSENFTGLFGLPFASLQWTPSFPWSYTLSLFGPTYNAEVAYGSLDEAQYFFGTSWSRQVFQLSEREENRDRLTIEEKKLQVGIRAPFLWKLISEFSIGRSFDRRLYVGQGFNQVDDGEKNLEAANFVSWNLKLGF